MFHRKQGFPFEIVPIKTNNPVEAQLWLYLDTNFYKWATFETGKYAYTDLGVEKLFPLLKEYRDDMTGEELLILVK